MSRAEDLPMRPSGRMTGRVVMRIGYGAVLALLVLSTVEAYQIQRAVLERNVETYRRYVQQESAASELRRAVWHGASGARDFFLSSRPDSVAVFRSQLQELKTQSGRALDRLDQPPTSGRAHQALRARTQEFWRTLEPIAESMADANASAAYEFVQREIVPRRSAVSEALRELNQANQEALKNAEPQLAGSRQAATRRLFLMLGFCTVLGLLAAGFSLRYAEKLERETARRYEELVQGKQDLKRLSARLLEIQEEERRALSRELHDEVGQTITALRIEISHALASAEAPEARERLERARGLAERMLQTVRDISLLLRPALLDDLGLAPALEWQLEDFSRRSGIRCEFHEEGLQNDIPDAVKTCVYRAVQESLHNCERHAAASMVRVVVRQVQELLTVEVEDNGRGFELDSKGLPCRSTGLGVLGIRERVATVKGTLSLNSAPGQGTRLLLRIPLVPAGARPPAAPACDERDA